MSETILCLLSIISILLGCGLLVASAIYLDKKELDKKEQADIEWLNNEKLKPKYRIQFIVSMGSSFGPIWTSTFEPANSLAGNPWNIRYTSKSLAEIHLKNSYERSYFMDEAGVTYPVCQVLQAWVEEVGDIKNLERR